MAELAALSIAANVAQFVVLGLQSAQYMYKAYNQTEDFINQKAELDAVSRGIGGSIDSINAIPEIKHGNKDLAELLNLAKDLARELEVKFARLRGYAARGGRVARTKLAMRSFWDKGEIRQLHDRLVSLRDQISYHLIILSSESKGAVGYQLQATNTKIEANNTEMSKRLDDLHQNLMDLRGQMEATAHQDQVTSLFEAMANLASETSNHCLLRKRGERVLNSLRFDNILDRKSNIPEAHEKTFQWALSGTTTTLPDWLRSGDGVYWIEGKAGSGKSTLMKFLQQSPRTTVLLKEWAGKCPLLFAGHYFWAPGTDLQRSFLGLLRTLMFQIFLHDPELMDVVCPSRMNQSDYVHLEPWTLQELKECFNTLASMSSLPSKLCVFIDGLDEFQGSYADLIDFVQTASKSSNIKLCVSSRPWTEFREAFEASPKLHVHELTTEDISRYARENLERDSHYQSLHSLSPEEAAGLVNELISMAQGVFLWVYLAVRELLRGLQYDDDISTLRRRLKSLPKHLEDYFERMLENIDTVYHGETSVFYSILANTECPLDTYITWAYRESRVFGRKPETFDIEISPVHNDGISALARRANKLTRDAAGSDSEAEIGLNCLNLDDYSPKREQARMRARCRDLVHVADQGSSTDLTSKTVFSITFLHRTVADFFQLPRIREIISKRIALESRPEETFLPLATLAHIHLELLWSTELLGDERGNDAIMLMMIALAREVKKSSEWTYYELLHKLCSLYNDRRFHESVVLAKSPIWKVSIERWSGFDDSSAGDERVFLQSGYHLQVKGKRVRFPLHSSSDPYFNRLFWTVHCRECFEAVDLDDFQKLLSLSMTDKPIVLPDLATGEIIRSDIQEKPRVNLGMVRDLMNTKVWRDEVERGKQWFVFLDETQRMRALPPNFYDGIRIMIQHGAPRWIPRKGHHSPIPGPVVKKDRRGRNYFAIDATHLLAQIPAIAEHDPDGMVQDFIAAENRDKDRDSNVLTSLRGLLGW